MAKSCGRALWTLGVEHLVLHIEVRFAGLGVVRVLLGEGGIDQYELLGRGCRSARSSARAARIKAERFVGEDGKSGKEEFRKKARTDLGLLTRL
jgi:hypothetical protein